jgi:hypothetical protein
MNKPEILKALNNVNHTFDWITFEGELYETETVSFEIESEHHNIDLEVEITVRFESYDFYEMDQINLTKFEVHYKDGGHTMIDEENFELFYTEDEILDNITIEI